MTLALEPAPADGYHTVQQRLGARCREPAAIAALCCRSLPAGRIGLQAHSRTPAFAVRIGQYDPNRAVAEYVAQLGVAARAKRYDRYRVPVKLLLQTDPSTVQTVSR